MPFFRYSATDNAGARKDGTIEAATADDAMLALVRQGLNVSQIIKSMGSPPGAQTQTSTGRAGPQPIQQERQVIKPVQPQPAKPATLPAAAPLTSPAKAPVQTTRTKRASDKDRMFFFSQLGSQLKAGINPAQALDMLKTRVPAYMAGSIQQASLNAQNGQPISDALAKYPDLYPEHVVGTIRAAEMGGFLPEGCVLISDQAQNAHSFARWFWWVRPMLINGLVSIPLAYLVMKGLIDAWHVTEGAGEDATQAQAVGGLVAGVVHRLIWPVGPLTLALWAAVYGFAVWMRSTAMTRFRHEVIFRWPIFGRRAKHEALSVFTWVMGKVSKAGVSPNQSWELAAGSVPNAAIRERLRRMGNNLSGQEKLSETLFKEKLFPNEYAPIIATAEHTGDIPGAFDQLSRISQAEFDASQSHARMKSARWGYAGCLAISGIILIILTWFFYRVLYPEILKGLDL